MFWPTIIHGPRRGTGVATEVIHPVATVMVDRNPREMRVSVHDNDSHIVALKRVWNFVDNGAVEVDVTSGSRRRARRFPITKTLTR